MSFVLFLYSLSSIKGFLYLCFRTYLLHLVTATKRARQDSTSNFQLRLEDLILYSEYRYSPRFNAGPFLFLVYVNDFISYFTTKFYQFADDKLLF